jgi:hypothetical protein
MNQGAETRRSIRKEQIKSMDSWLCLASRNEKLLIQFLAKSVSQNKKALSLLTGLFDIWLRGPDLN